MIYNSARSIRFMEWLRKAQATADLEKLTDLEMHARLLVHAYDLTGEVRPEDIAALSRASKTLQATYEQNAGE